MIILETKQLALKKLTIADSAFLIEILNSDGWQKFIGDRNVHNRIDAARYINDITGKGLPAELPALHVVFHKLSFEPIGLAGILKRDHLDAPDIGIALLPQFEGKGYAFEICSALLNYAKNNLTQKEILAITAPNNFACQKLLTKIGMQNLGIYFDGIYQEELVLFKSQPD